MSEKKNYVGGCHCGKVRYEVNIDLTQVIACNCSLCSRTGWLLAFVPGDDFALRDGDGALTDYQFGKKHIHHQFCSTCGVNSFSHGVRPVDGQKMYAVNVRCLEGVEVDSFPVKRVDGKSL
jgi:hypothetical protein